MSLAEEEFLRTLHAAFQVEAVEHLQAIAAGLLELEKDPASAAQTPVLERVYREAHSLKGAARAVNLSTVEQVCQSLESVLSAGKRHELALSPRVFDALHRGLDTVGRLIEKPDAAIPENVADILQQNERLLADDPPAPPASELPIQAPVPLPPDKPLAADSVRIATAKLDALILEAEEMLAVKLTASQRAADVRALRVGFEGWKKEWARVSPELTRLAGAPAPAETASAASLTEFITWNAACLSALDSKMAALLRALEQDQHFIDHLVTELGNDTRRLLMLPFATLLAAFPKLVRDLCRDQGKEAEFVLRGGDVEIDKRILEEMKDPLIHILRNCVDHGLEMPDERARQNKPPRATITLAVAQVEGNKVEIVVTDDGAGIDAAKVREAARCEGLLTADEEQRGLSNDEAVALIFRSGVSTSSALTEISGRGLGLAIVQEKTAKLGGLVSVQTAPGHGTTFRFLLPLTMATFRGIFVQASGQVFVLPTASVERVIRFKPDDLKPVQNRETIFHQDRHLAFVRLGDVLELPAAPANHEAAPFLTAVVLGAGDQRIAFGIDDLLREEEVLVKRLQPPLRRVRNIAGATVLGTGRPVPILNVADLLKSAVHVRRAPPKPPVAPPAAAARLKSVLVAEDSITSRMLLKSILEAAGYQVKTAVDGADAFALLHEKSYDLVVSDVQMPRMNGLELTARIRRDPVLSHLPVILVTALATPADRARGLDAGANAYLVKSSFDQSNLLETIRKLK